MSKIYKVSIFIFLIIISIISTFYFVSISYAESIMSNKNSLVESLISREVGTLKKNKQIYEIKKDVFLRDDFKNLTDNEEE